MALDLLRVGQKIFVVDRFDVSQASPGSDRVASEGGGVHAGT